MIFVDTHQLSPRWNHLSLAPLRPRPYLKGSSSFAQTGKLTDSLNMVMKCLKEMRALLKIKKHKYQYLKGDKRTASSSEISQRR